MTLWANILEVILEFIMIVILLMIQGDNNFTYKGLCNKGTVQLRADQPQSDGCDWLSV